MGLDMYLTAEKFFGGYSDEVGRSRVLAACGDDIPPFARTSGSAVVSFEVACWRKANAVHGWFVENVQDGNDDCDRHHVSVDALKELLALCEGVLDGSADADDLPPTSGFFFGPTDDEEWYREYLALTVEQLKPLIAWFEADEGRRGQWDLFYQSSW